MILYKYYPDNSNSFKSITVNGLWCSHAKNMNDPFECLGFVNRTFNDKQLNLFRETAEKYKGASSLKISKLSNKELTESINGYRKELVHRFAFCSLSESFDDILMWSHYASAHKGFVIGYEFDDEEVGYHLQIVKYFEEDLPELDMSMLASFLGGKEEYASRILADISIKSSDWKREREWRIWRKKEGYFYYDPKRIKSIYFGVNCDVITQNSIIKLIPNLSEKFNFIRMEQALNPIRLTSGD